MTAADLEQADSEEVLALIESGTQQLIAKGAHYVIESFADLPALIDQINGELSKGNCP